MEDNLEYVDLAGGGGQGSVLYVQDGLMEGPSGEQYVTIIQDGQTYAIPAADYAAMIAQQDVEDHGTNDQPEIQDIQELESPEIMEVPIQGMSQPGESSKVQEAVVKPPTIVESKNTEVSKNTVNQEEFTAPSTLSQPQQIMTAKPSQQYNQPTTLQQNMGVTNVNQKQHTVAVNTEQQQQPSISGNGVKEPQPNIQKNKPEQIRLAPPSPNLIPSAPPSKASGSTGMSMQWMTNTTQHPTSKPKIVQKSDSQKKHLYPTIQEVVQRLPEKVSPQKKNYKPIRVDNWGIFLLSRLQNYFQKKEYCDLTLRFPTKNAQIKVHKLILNACTEFFCQLEKDGKLSEGAIDMPANFTPEAVAPIIRFMYTGKLDLKEATYKKLYETAEILQMSVLTKLMDAQINAPDAEGPWDKRALKRRNSGAFEDDPVEQMRKIRRIEKRVALEGKKKNRQDNINRLKQDEALQPCLPGKKLPIWKRKIPDHVQTPVKNNTSNESPDSSPEKLFTPDKPTVVPLPGYKIPKLGEPEKDLEKNPFLKAGPSNTVGAILNEHIENSRSDDDDSTRHIKIEPESGQLIPTPHVSNTYKKRSPGEKPKIPRRLQEIQQHLMFEKILRTGAKNTVMKKVDTNTGKSSDLSIEEVKALVEEQKQRMAAISQDDDEDDYYDDSIDIGDDYIDNVDSPGPVTVDEFNQEGPSSSDNENLDTSTEINQKAQEQENANQINQMIQPIFAEPEPSKKTVRFSLRPSQIEPSSNLNSSEKVETIPKSESTTTVLKIIQSSQKLTIPTMSTPTFSSVSTNASIDLPVSSMPMRPKEDAQLMTATPAPSSITAVEIPKSVAKVALQTLQVKHVDTNKLQNLNLSSLTSAGEVVCKPAAPVSTGYVRTMSQIQSVPKPLNLVPVSKPFQTQIPGRNLVLINSKPQMSINTTPSQPNNTPLSNNAAASNDKQQITLNLPSDQESNKQDVRNELDEALDEFSRVAEEEAEELCKNEENHFDPKPNCSQHTGNVPDVKQPNHDHRKPRRGRPPRWLKEQTLQMGWEAKQKRTEAMQEETSSIDLKPETPLPVKAEMVPENPPDQSQVINEVLKKYPNLFKDNKSVKIKIMTKDASGKNVTKFITLKAQPQAASIPDARVSSPLGSGINSLKPIQKVMYTGRRGRPKKVKPGEFDPHQEERKQIEERLMRDYPQLANQISQNEEEMYEDADEELQEEDYEVSRYTSLEQVSSQSQLTTATTTEASHHPLDPSSEAEALSNVASGIAASLGLVEQQQHIHDGTALIVPPMEAPISHYQPGQAIMMENGQIHIVAQGQQMVNVENNPTTAGEFIQILTPDGQLQNLQYSMPKSEKQTISNVVPATSGLHPVHQTLMTPGVVPGSSRIIQGNYTGISSGISLGSNVSSGIPLAPGIAVAPGMMTIAPALYHNSQSMIPVSTHMMHTSAEMIQSSATIVQGSPQLVPVSSQMIPVSSHLVPVAAHLVPVNAQVLPGSQQIVSGTQQVAPEASLGQIATLSSPSKVVHKIVSDWDSDDENQD